MQEGTRAPTARFLNHTDRSFGQLFRRPVAVGAGCGHERHMARHAPHREESAGGVEVVFCDALDAEDLWEAIEARNNDDTAVEDAEPILLAMSDNGPQMRAGITRECFALCILAAHYSRPGAPPTKPGSRASSGTSRPNGPNSNKSPTQRCCAPDSTRSAVTTTPGACTPPSPPTNTPAAANSAARPAATASPEPAGCTSPSWWAPRTSITWIVCGRARPVRCWGSRRRRRRRWGRSCALFTWGHVRQLDKAAAGILGRACAAGGVPGTNR